MKKIIFAILAGCSLLAAQAGVDLLSTLQSVSARRRKQTAAATCALRS